MSGVIRQLPLCTVKQISPQNRSGNFGVKKTILHPGIRVTGGSSRNLTTSAKYATPCQVQQLHKNTSLFEWARFKAPPIYLLQHHPLWLEDLIAVRPAVKRRMTTEVSRLAT
jgi:hypothetical protein